jgi:hypothetical protein
MLEEIHYHGEWWIPSNPDKRIKGTLTFNQDIGAVLDLIEPFEVPYKTIYGINSAGTEMTLLECTQLSINFPGSPCKILGQLFFFGALFESKQDILFDSYYCQLSHVNDWIFKSGIKTENEFSKNIVIKFDCPDTISILISPDVKMDIEFQPSFSINRNESEIKLKQVSQISFHPKEKTKLDEYLKLMHHFRNFLCLFTQETVFPQKIYGIIKNSNMPLVNIYYKLDAPTSIRTDVFNPLLEYKYLGNKFEIYLQNWYTKYDDLEPIFTLYSGTYYGRFVYLNLKFLCLVQALEAYYRRFIQERELPIKEHKERISSILSSVPSIYMEWLTEKLEFSNEPPLLKQLNAIYSRFAKEPMYLFLGDEVFTKKVKDTRHYLTHYDKKLKKKAADGIELFVITEKLRILVELCLLNEIGFSMKELSELIRQKYVQRLNQLPIYKQQKSGLTQ